MLVHKYEMFQMKQNKIIISMFTHFMDIINCLKNLGRTYTNSDIIKKILRSLSRTWEAKVTAIQKAKDLSTLPLEELLDSLMTHELMMKQKSKDESKKKKTIALKATTMLKKKKRKRVAVEKEKVIMKWPSLQESLKNF